MDENWNIMPTSNLKEAMHHDPVRIVVGFGESRAGKVSH